MKLKPLHLILVLACVAIALPALSQRGADPVSGTWTGDWGPNTSDRNQVTVVLKLDGRNVTGTVQSTRPQRPEVTLQKSTFDAATGALHMEAEAQGRGGAVRYIIDGKLTNGSITGSWNHSSGKGDFTLKK